MILLSVSIIIALLITIALPIAGGLWLKSKFQVPWRVVTYGAFGYLVLQALLTLVMSGFSYLVQNEMLELSDQALITAQIGLRILFGGVLGVILRWAGMKYLKGNLDRLETAFSIGIGFGGMESLLLVGLPLLTTFITMLSNINIDPQTSTLDPAVIIQIQDLWQVPFWVPLVGSLERIAAMMMHITVTILIFQVFKRQNNWWLAAAIGLEVLVNGLIAGLSETGLSYAWLIMVALVLMGVNILILYRLHAFDLAMSLNNEESDSPSKIGEELD